MRSRRAAARAIEEAERENAGAHASAARISVYPTSPNVVAARVRVWFEFGMKPKRCCSPSAIFSSHELKKGPYLWHPSFHCGRRTPGCESAWRLLNVGWLIRSSWAARLTLPVRATTENSRNRSQFASVKFGFRDGPRPTMSKCVRVA
jgi:hypothetical protein